MYELTNNTSWLAGYAMFERGEHCPWDPSARLGWIAARKDAVAP